MRGGRVQRLGIQQCSEQSISLRMAMTTDKKERKDALP